MGNKYIVKPRYNRLIEWSGWQVMAIVVDKEEIVLP